MDFIIGRNTMKYKTTNSRFKLLIFKQTRICEPEANEFPNLLFNFKTFEAILSAYGDDDGMMFDNI